MHVNKAATAAVFFMFGTGLSSLDVGWIICLFAVFSALTFFLIKRGIGLFFAFIILFSVLCGAFYYNCRISWGERGLAFGVQAMIYGVINDFPEKSGGMQRFVIKPDGTSATISAVTYSSIPLKYGDLVEVSGMTVKKPGGKISFAAPVSPKVIKHNTGSGIKSALFALKSSLEGNIKRALPPDKTALAIGTLLGDKSDFTKEFNSALKRSGLAHIAALSGYNVMIFVRYLTPIVGFFVLHRGWRLAAVSFVVIAFIAMTGASASLMRAGIMGIISLVLKNRSRLTDVKFILVWTALLMVLISPAVLIFDLGFSLSFAALIGLIYIEPLLKKWLARLFGTADNFWNGWKGLVLQTLSAEAAVSPIILITFRQFSPWAVLSNLLILPFLPATMFLTFITAMGGYVSSILSAVLSWPLYLLVEYEEMVVNLFGGGLI